METDVLCLGETMALFVPGEPGPVDQVRTWIRTFGGAESNVACNLAMLGLRAGWVSAVGQDAFGKALLAAVGSAGVDVSGVVVDPARPTGLYIKESNAGGSPVRYYRQGSAASGMGPELLDKLDLNVRVLHLTGITAALSDSCLDLTRALFAVPRPTHKLSFDLNWRPKLWASRDPAVLRELANAADIVLAGDDETQEVWGTSDPAEIRRILPGPSSLVIKHGARGATLLENGEQVFQPALRVDVVEPVGAGDAFAAGFLAATLAGQTPVRRLRSGHLQAAVALRTHDDVGTPLPPELVNTLLGADEGAWAAAHLTGQGVS
ncbi:2-dehydro-3-deoxygluconokinase [Kibdelosporangium banguiense]|uniref:2-dehydro-3-deoxygluconokinase n=1 Tax=Kibdelosporangium banguiense TaxID=1365924 RepID=A0ABS4TJN8_9PSEU|nr:sugar kinase [Kibdelosporangium banguiense]MBP2324633.1 2-dehydro-3-deoxygluconokinase [Kibdelosporangium banguiense]